MENKAMNETLRRGVGKAAPEPPEDRKQSGVKDPAEMSVPEMLEEKVVIGTRSLALDRELMARADKAESEEPPEDA